MFSLNKNNFSSLFNLSLNSAPMYLSPAHIHHSKPHHHQVRPRALGAPANVIFAALALLAQLQIHHMKLSRNHFLVNRK